MATVHLAHDLMHDRPVATLAGFELEPEGATQAAAESLAALDLAAKALELGTEFPYARAAAHLEASRHATGCAPGPGR
jgi:hypothetical protein